MMYTYLAHFLAYKMPSCLTARFNDYDLRMRNCAWQILRLSVVTVKARPCQVSSSHVSLSAALMGVN